MMVQLGAMMQLRVRMRLRVKFYQTHRHGASKL